MKMRYRLIRRNLRGGTFYCVDTLCGKRSSLGTQDEEEAMQIVQAKNQALRQPVLNLQIGKAYLAASDSGITTRTWQAALQAIIEIKEGETKARWIRASQDRAFDLIRSKIIIETQADHFLQVLNAGTVSTNVHLRKLHNFCLDMNWLPWPVLPKKQWPPVHYQEKRAITWSEHQQIVQRERNPESQAFYELCWHLGGSQSDIANLRAEDVDWNEGVIAFHRKKTRSVSIIHFGEHVAEVFRRLPAAGPLFPRMALVHEKHRAKEFKRRCQGLGIHGVTLHSYRYAWAERAKICGYPERFAQEALGHNSKAVHRAYAKKAQVKVPSLEEYERRRSGQNVVVVNFAVAKEA